MKKRGITYNIFKAALITTGLLLFLFSLAITALYIPAIQQFAARKACKAIKERSGYDIETETFTVHFPLRIEIGGLYITKDNTLYAKGDKIGLDVPFLPLLRGKIKNADIQLEGISINSREMIPGVRITGNAGYSSAEAGCIDIKAKNAEVQLLQLINSDIEINISDTAKNKEKSQSGWIVKLHKGCVENCSAKINIPHDTLEISLSVSGLRLKEGEANLERKSYGIAELEISDAEAVYNNGQANSIKVADLSSNTNDIFFSPEKSHIDVKEMSFIQPGGIEVCNSHITMTADSSNAEIKELEINTLNGSHITATAFLPWSAISPESYGNGFCEISLAIVPKDLNIILARKASIPDYGKLTAVISANGNATRTEIGKIEIDMSETGYLEANGYACNLYNTDNTTAGIEIKEAAVNIGRLTGSNTAVTANGKLSYAAGNAKCDINIKAGKGVVKCLAGYRLYENIYNVCITATRLDINEIFPDFPIKYSDMTLQAEISVNAKEESGVSRVGITVPNGSDTAKADIEFGSTPDGTFIKATNGDLRLAGEMDCGYRRLASSMEKLKRISTRTIHADSIEYLFTDYANILPNMSLSFECGRSNMLYPFITSKNFDIENFKFKSTIGKDEGLGMDCRIQGFEKGEIKLDSVTLYAKQSNESIKYMAKVRNDAGKQVYNAALYGNIFKDSITTGLIFSDSNDEINMDLGATGVLSGENISIKFNRDAILFGNKFIFSGSDFLKIGKSGNVEADISVTSDSNAGIHIFTTPDRDAKLYINLELSNIDIQEMTKMLPHSPDITGTLNIDLRLRQDDNGTLLSGDAHIEEVTYNGRYIGNEIVEGVYFPQSGNRHLFDARLNHNDKDVLQIYGIYTAGNEENYMEGNLRATRVPARLAGIFIKDELLALDGYANGNINVKGPLAQLVTNGEIQLDSVYLYTPLSGTKLHFSDTTIIIKNNMILFDGFKIYAQDNSHFKITGYADISKLSAPQLNLKMNAESYELVNSRRGKGSMLYGKLFANIDAFINGGVEELNIGGNATLLGKSDITYILQGKPIAPDKELDGVVEFVNFKDTAKVLDTGRNIDFGNTNIGLRLKIEDGARINADFNDNGKSYLKLRGGGDLNMTYGNANGMNMTGSYTVDEGVLKYELPIIPLKTFNIESGSKVTWNGNVQNPTLEILAVEKITASVKFEDNSIQPVTFTVGIKLTNTISNMGLSFTIAAPENAAVQEQLNSLDEETLNKYAIAMLITGTYIGGSNGMNVSNALTSFLDAKINELAGNAMKSVNVSIGINDAQDAGNGGVYKNYTFSFSKRLWNDRLTIIIGGEVNSGNAPDGEEAFLNNVSLEWKLGKNGNRYLRLFYDRNFESLLEGEIVETGIGYVYKRKLDNPKELFITEGKEVGKNSKAKE